MKKLGILSLLLMLLVSSVVLADKPIVEITAPQHLAQFELGDDGTVTVQFQADITDVDNDLVPASIRWEFGDGDVALGQANEDPQHTYRRIGEFRVVLLASDAAGGNSVADLLIGVVDNVPPAEEPEPQVERVTIKEMTRVADQRSLGETPKFSLQDGDETVRFTFKVVNEGNVALQNLKVTTLFGEGAEAREFLKHNNDDIEKISFTFSTENDNNDVIENLAPGAETVVTGTMRVDSGFEVSKYKPGKILVLKADNTELAKVDINVRGGEVFCVAGPMKDASIKIDVKDPEDDDKIRIGDKVKIQVEVENKLSEEQDFVVEGFLYNLDKGKVIDEFETSDESIDRNDNVDFTFELFVDPSEIDDDKDKVVLFIKTSVDGDEELYCKEDEVELEIDQDDHDVRFEEFTLLPQTASCDAPVEGRIEVRNFGKKSADTVLKLRNTELGLDSRSETFELEKLQDKEDKEDRRLLSFRFNVPEDADEKEYTIEAIARFENKDKSAFATLNVAGCKKKQEPVKAPEEEPVRAVVTTTQPGTAVVTETPQQATTQTAPSTATYSEKDVFEVFNRSEIPTAVWIAIDLVLVLVVLGVLAVVLRKR